MNIIMGSPARYDLLLDQGSTLRFQATWTAPDGTPIDLTGYRVLFQIRLMANSPTALMTFDSNALASGQEIGTLGPSGLVDITVSDELTAALPADVLTWDLLVQSASGVRDKLVYGRVFVRPTVTQVS